MSSSFAIHGYGRIGRCFLRAWAQQTKSALFPVAINEPADSQSILYLSRFDSCHGAFPLPLALNDENDELLLKNFKIALTHSQSIAHLEWKNQPEIIVECSGQYGERKDLESLLKKGGKRLILSHPGNSEKEVDATVIFGFNEKSLTGEEKIISAASCTTLASVPILSFLNQTIGIERVFITTLHSAMNDQPLLDGYHHTDLRRTRAALVSIIPVATGLAQGIERFLPTLKNKVVARAIRTPTLNVSALDITLILEKSIALKDLENLFKNAVDSQILPFVAYTHAAHASVDFNHNAYSAIVDFSQMKQNGNAVQLFIWFDNEWAYSQRLLDLAEYLAQNF